MYKNRSRGIFRFLGFFCYTLKSKGVLFMEILNAKNYEEMSIGRKDEAYKYFMSRKASTRTPASFLWLHPNCTTIIDREKFPK